MVIESDGRILIPGAFTQLNGTNINYIARLNNDNSEAASFQLLSPNQYFGMYLQGVVSNSYRVEWATNLNVPSLWTPLFDVTLRTNPQFIVDPSPISGERYYRAVQLSP